jgi:hypothetical protein
MEWHTSYLFSVDSSYLNKVYNHDFIITLDELPKIDSIYGWDSVCIPTAIVPNFKIGSGSWQQSNKIGRYKNQDSIVTLSPVATGAGKWKWSGCGISDTSREQNFAITDFCTATVSYVNECGATSTKSFFVYNNCTSTAIAPHLQVDGGALQDTFRVTIDSGSFVTLIPEADTGGKWLWSGCKILIDSLQEQTISPASSCAPKVTYTNYCGKVSSKTFLIYVNRPSGISKKYINPGVSLFPDPCKEILNIQINQLPINSVSLVNVYSLQGSLLLTETVKSGNIKLNTSPLAPNIYIIKIVNNNFEITRKFVKVE